MSPDAEHDASLYGHGVSDHEDGVLVHIAAGPWQIRYWAGTPSSLWPEERDGCWMASVWARCGRGLTWKSGPPSATTARPCPACLLSDAAISARQTRIR
ncbi:hypothetical protein [Streptomyces marianii]|uniref:Uncharacterized protein n=1 Tax=Streptomyces marianii TaxID=1817406 RepID=A0A5R9DSZ2_9ACTN|nr:hypothetical protein [Streptomyces marianii]TLQ39216.1 hypothetical protein FEF34_38100 [Streptomyces marianii]